ncbi:MAG: hypothetical protein RLN89_08505 [Parvibaculum sp.]
MFKFLGGFQQYAIIGGALLIAASLAYAYHAFTVSGLERDISRVKVDLAVCEGDVVTLQQAIGKQNEQIVLIAERARAASDRASGAASEAARLAGERRREVLNRPGAGPDHMNQFMGELHAQL